MSNLPSLLFHPHPGLMEGPQGYLLHLAAENHLLLYDIGRLNIHFEAENLQRHGLMPDLRVEPELSARVRRISTLWNTEKGLWNHRFSRFCPECLAAEPVWHADWELYFQDACPEHRVWLVDHCSSCQQPVSWHRKSIIRCDCGADLRREVAAACPEDVVRMAEILRAKLFGQPAENVPLPLKVLSLGQMQQLIRFFGAGTVNTEGRHPLKIPDSGAMNISWAVTSAAAAILMDWPAAFHQVLDQLQSKVVDADGHALKTTFGWVYQYLFRGLKGSGFDAIRDEFGEWVSTRWKGGVAKRNRRLAAMMMNRAVWIPAKIARDELGISQPRLERLIREGVLDSESFVSDSGRRFCMVRRDQLVSAKEKLSGGMDMLAAAELLGFSKRRMRSILKLLFPNASKSSDLPGSVWFVPRSDVEAVLALTENLPVVSIPDEGCVSVSHILRYWTWRSLDIVAAIESAMAKELRPLARIDTARGVASLVFEEAALKHWFESNARGVGQWLTCPQFAIEYSLSQQVAYELVSFDFIKAERLPNMRHGGWWLSRKAIEAFFRDYVFASEIGARMGVMSIVARKRLEEQSIMPVSGPGVDGAKKLLYRRTPELESFILESGQSQDFVLTPTGSAVRKVGKSKKRVLADDRGPFHS